MSLRRLSLLRRHLTSSSSSSSSSSSTGTCDYQRSAPVVYATENDVATVSSEQIGPVSLIRFCRPRRRNAVNQATARALTKAFLEFEASPNSSVAVLFGDGGDFCAGADLQSFDNDLQPADDVQRGPMGPTRLNLSKPVVAAISGYSVAGGLELALWADMRVADLTAQFGVLCRRVGVPLIDGGTVRLPRLIGQAQALDLILTGRLVNATEAHSMGLVNRLVSADESVLDAAVALATQIAAFPQLCLRGDLRSAKQQWSLTETEALAKEFDAGYAVATSEGVEGAARFSRGEGRHGKPMGDK